MYRADSMAFEVPIIPIRYVRALVAFMVSRGISQAVLLDGTGVQEKRLGDSAQLFSMTQLVQLLKRAGALLQDEHFAFEFGQQLDARQHGLLGLSLLQQREHRTLVRTIVDYLRVAFPMMELRIGCLGDEIDISLGDAWDLGELRPFIVKMYMGSIHALVSPVFRNFSLEFDFLADERRFQDNLGSSVQLRFGCSENRVILPLSEFHSYMGRAGLDRYFPDESDRSVCRNIDAPDRRASISTDNGGAIAVVAKVRRHIMNDPGRNGCLERISDEIGMSSRAVRYHLNLAGVSFHDIRNDIRETYATRYLTETRLPVRRIAEKMGYSDQASFTKAYRSWTGKTPGDVRRQGQVSQR